MNSLVLPAPVPARPRVRSSGLPSGSDGLLVGTAARLVNFPKGVSAVSLSNNGTQSDGVTKSDGAARPGAGVVVRSSAKADDVASSTQAQQFAEIYRSNHAQVLGFISRRLIPRDYARAEEIAHDTFLVAWRRFNDLPSNENAIRAWLFTTARNLILKSNDLSRRRNLGVRISDDAMGFIPSSSSEIDSRGLQIDLNAAWAMLSPAEQEIISLAYWDELTSVEAGRVLGISDRLYRQKLHRARAKLRKLLEGSGG